MAVHTAVGFQLLQCFFGIYKGVYIAYFLFLLVGKCLVSPARGNYRFLLLKGDLAYILYGVYYRLHAVRLIRRSQSLFKRLGRGIRLLLGSVQYLHRFQRLFICSADILPVGKAGFSRRGNQPGKLSLVCGVPVARAAAAHYCGAAYIRTVAQRELHAHDIAVRNIIVGKAHIGEHIVYRIHPARAHAYNKLAQISVAVFNILRVEEVSLFYQALRQHRRYIYIGAYTGNAVRGIALCIAVIARSRFIAVCDIGAIEARLRGSAVIYVVAVHLKQPHQLLSRRFALYYRHFYGLNKVAAAQSEYFHAPHGPARFTALGHLFIVYIVCKLGCRAAGGHRLYLNDIFAGICENKGVAGFFAVVPGVAHPLPVEGYLHRDFAAFAVPRPNIKGQAGALLCHAVPERGGNLRRLCLKHLLFGAHRIQRRYIFCAYFLRLLLRARLCRFRARAFQQGLDFRPFRGKVIAFLFEALQLLYYLCPARLKPRNALVLFFRLLQCRKRGKGLLLLA